MNCQIFTTPKCERPYLLLKATSQSEFCFSLILIICSTVSGPEALKKVSAIFHIQFQWNVTEHFRNSIIQKHGVIVLKSLSETKFWGEKIRRHVFIVSRQTSYHPKFVGKRTNSIWLVAFRRDQNDGSDAHVLRSWNIRQFISFQHSWYSVIASSISF